MVGVEEITASAKLPSLLRSLGDASSSSSSVITSDEGRSKAEGLDRGRRYENEKKGEKEGR